ncbi:alpha-L-arabinofuranosidase [Streptosporangium album]|uniref:Alpha-L-arabinofuranosidase n=1 Tax=Streptosporangium album TaxID=47479 RepID=A0A7W7RPN7_9ACTN|nr:alpha-L-arabinofuranosidase C-terminal domain-containing protein [Streptosporangium album]MBB4935841.1 alpha-L-arabinofuranosidase [Streptosporangium album]
MESAKLTLDPAFEIGPVERRLFGGEASLEWAEAPRILEEEYDATVAAVVGSLLITLLNHADRVGIACQAQLANVIALIPA